MSAACLPRLIAAPASSRKLDRLGWKAGLAFRSYGLRVGVRTNRPEMLASIKECLPPGWQAISTETVAHLFSVWIGGEHSRSRDDCRLYQGAALQVRLRDRAALLDALEGCVQMCVAEWSPRRVFVHAGVVAWQGQALVIPGRSMSGKSTLVEALLRAGATYYSDEYAVLDERGRVHAYPRRLSLRQPKGKPRRCSARELGGRTGRAPLPVGLVAVTKYLPGANWRPRPLSPGRAVLELLNNTVPALVKPEAVLKALHRVAPGARSLMGVRGEADETAEALLREMGRCA